MSMGKITSINQKRAIIEFSNFCIRVFTKYEGPYCTEIRIWKLPSRGSFWSMFNTKNLVWAIYGDQAKVVHGWFAQRSQNWLQELAQGIARVEDYDGIKEFLISVEGVINGDTEAMAKLAISEEE